jgi:hypothetical protein
LTREQAAELFETIYKSPAMKDLLGTEEATNLAAVARDFIMKAGTQ